MQQNNNFDFTESLKIPADIISLFVISGKRWSKWCVLYIRDIIVNKTKI